MGTLACLAGWVCSALHAQCLSTRTGDSCGFGWREPGSGQRQTRALIKGEPAERVRGKPESQERGAGRPPARLLAPNVLIMTAALEMVKVQGCQATSVLWGLVAEGTTNILSLFRGGLEGCATQRAP